MAVKTAPPTMPTIPCPASAPACRPEPVVAVAVPAVPVAEEMAPTSPSRPGTCPGDPGESQSADRAGDTIAHWPEIELLDDLRDDVAADAATDQLHKSE